MPLTSEQSSKIADWFVTKKQLDELKEKESKLRDELIKDLFAADKDSGTDSIEIGQGYKLMATKKLDYKLNNKEGQVEAVIAVIGHDAVREMKLIRWEPALSITAYKNLDHETQKLFDGCLTIKPGKPSLEVIPPKAE